MEAKKPYKPYWLLIFFIFVVSGIITLGVIAGMHQWEMDNSFMSNYNNVDKNYNQIAQDQKNFDSKYNIKMDSSAFKMGKNTLKIDVLDKNNSAVNNAQVVAVITRPDTNALNQTIQNFTLTNGSYTSNEFDLQKMGRWIVEYKVTVNNVTGFFKIERQVPIR